MRTTLSGRLREGLTHYKVLMEAGPDAIAAIRQKLLNTDWSEIDPSGKLAFLTALLSALHDIDENACRSVAAEILDSPRGCHFVTATRIHSIATSTIDEYGQFAIGTLSVFVLRSLGALSSVRPHLELWLANLPPQDVSGIERLYVVDGESESDYWGKYLHVLAKIVLVWRAKPLFLGALKTEATLYHEVGHHVHCLNDDSRSENEAKANLYAWKVFAAVHPELTRWFGPLISILVLGTSFTRPSYIKETST